MQQSWLFVVIQLIFLEGVLSLDNAAVLGAMVAVLPRDRVIPWPGALRRVGRRLDPLLGAQRDAALKVGLLGAYLGRAIMLGLAVYIVRIWWLRLAGALYLLYLALRYLAAPELDASDDGNARPPVSAWSFWSVVAAVELTDLVFSLDNVIAAVALSADYRVVLLGVALGMVLMRFAAGVFSRLIAWETRLETAAYLIIFAIAAEILADELWGLRFVALQVGGLTIGPEFQQFAMTCLILALTLLYTRVPRLRALRPLWNAARQIAVVPVFAVTLATRPLGLVLRAIGTYIASLRSG